ncbi:YjcZ family sporulation protein [Priestia aryabhattai]|nr:YjcZ family sporulation protein [Priestia aryabhattai]MBY0065186.1 YjcZ family sporulation protein [Priestia aryabhattai]
MGFFGGYRGGCGYRYGGYAGNSGGSFAIIVVLFILLVIVGCTCFKGSY